MVYKRAISSFNSGAHYAELGGSASQSAQHLDTVHLYFASRYSACQYWAKALGRAGFYQIFPALAPGARYTAHRFGPANTKPLPLAMGKTEISKGRSALIWHAGAFFLFLLLSFILIDHGTSLASQILGRGTDPFAFIWFLAWWPWAIGHHLNPFWTDLVWQPSGYALLWGSSVPLLAFAAAPITFLAGPVVSFNVLVLLAPVLSAWCAYRLCLWLTAAPSSAIIGGLIFGFSTYQIAQAATLNLSFTFLLPCLIWVALKRLRAQISRWIFVGLICLILFCEFLISSEIFAMSIVFGSIAWLTAFVMLREERPVLSLLLADGLIAAPILIFLISPFLVAMFSRYPFVHLPALWPYFFVADPFGFVLPPRNNLVGGGYFQAAISDYFGDAQEQDSYIGLPIVMIICAFARTRKQQAYAGFLLAVFLLLLAASLGPRLWVAGHYTNIILPWSVFMYLPLLGGALPVRFALYVSLVASIIVALWVAASGNRRWRLGLAVIACVALWPKHQPSMGIPASAFFQPGRVQAVLGVNRRILVLPFGIHGPSSYWQVESHFAFSQTGGALGFPPAAMQIYPAIQALFGGDAAQLKLADFKAFVLVTSTQYIVVGPGTPRILVAMLNQLSWPQRQVDDVTIYTVPAFHG